MLRILSRPSSLCDQISRREMMRVGGLSLLGGLTLPRLLQAKESSRHDSKARSVLMFNLLGGPSHMDMVDLKPDAPVEIRGEFKPIATSVPGLRICEHLPRLAKLMHHGCVLRTFSHTFNSHDPFCFMTGYTDQGFSLQAQPSDPPDIGAICQYLDRGPKDLPGAVCMPCYPGWGEKWKRRGPYGGFLGSQYDPLFTRCDPTFDRKPKVNYYDPVLPIGEPLLPTTELPVEVTLDRMNSRQSLLQQIDTTFARAHQSPGLTKMDKVQGRAFAMLSSSRTRLAFDLSKESPKVRDRYGKSLTGNCLLTARRLVEAGVPFVSVHQEIFGANGHSYDMHENNFGMLKDFNLPLLDRVIPALLDDLESRGLLETTLVVVMGEMGRSPRINGKAGREHWPQCGFSLLFGAGVKHGHIHGATDKIAAYPLDHPVSPADFVATIYHLLGIDPEMTVPDRAGRPIPISHGGRPVQGLLA